MFTRIFLLSIPSRVLVGLQAVASPGMFNSLSDFLYVLCFFLILLMPALLIYAIYKTQHPENQPRESTGPENNLQEGKAATRNREESNDKQPEHLKNILHELRPIVEASMEIKELRRWVADCEDPVMVFQLAERTLFDEGPFVYFRPAQADKICKAIAFLTQKDIDNGMWVTRLIHVYNMMTASLIMHKKDLSLREIRSVYEIARSQFADDNPVLARHLFGGWMDDHSERMRSGEVPTEDDLPFLFGEEHID